jgi:hypothetical protein
MLIGRGGPHFTPLTALIPHVRPGSGISPPSVDGYPPIVGPLLTRLGESQRAGPPENGRIEGGGSGSSSVACRAALVVRSGGSRDSDLRQQSRQHGKDSSRAHPPWDISATCWRRLPNPGQGSPLVSRQRRRCGISPPPSGGNSPKGPPRQSRHAPPGGRVARGFCPAPVSRRRRRGRRARGRPACGQSPALNRCRRRARRSSPVPRGWPATHARRPDRPGFRTGSA